MTSSSLINNKILNKLKLNDLFNNEDNENNENNENNKNNKNNLTNLRDNINVSFITQLITDWVFIVVRSGELNKYNLVNVSSFTTNSSHQNYKNYTYKEDQQYLISFLVNKSKTKIKFLVNPDKKLLNDPNPLSADSIYREELINGLKTLDFTYNKFVINKYLWNNKNKISLNYIIRVTDDKMIVGDKKDEEVVLVTGSGINNPESFY